MNDLVSTSLLGWITDANLKAIFGAIIVLILISFVALGVDYLIRKTIIYFLNLKLKHSNSRFARLISDYHVLNSTALLVSGLVFVFGSFMLVVNGNSLSLKIAKTVLISANLFNLYILTFSLNRFIFALHDYYQLTSKRNDKSSWHSYIKIVSFFTWIIMAVLAAAYIFDQPPVTVITGLGALSAIVLLIFRDTILGIVASLQANATSMVRVGDWISIPKYNLEGTVEEISINSVRLRNFDNSVTTLPTYTLTTEAVKNWEYMSYSEGRRFRQEICLDPQSIHFVSPSLLTNLRTSYPNFIHQIESEQPNWQDLTNLSLFRLFLLNLLKSNPNLNQEYANAVRVNPLLNYGLPLEITGFTFETSSAGHEHLKSLVIEQAYAAMSLFELKPNQITT